jgi:hypothetical protein
MAFYADILSSSGVYKYYVDGEWKESASGKTVNVINPTTQKPEYQVQGAHPGSQLLVFIARRGYLVL